MGHPADAKRVHELLGRYSSRSAKRAAIVARFDRQGTMHLHRMVRPAGELNTVQAELCAKAAALHRALAEECQEANDLDGAERHMRKAHDLEVARHSYAE